MEVIGYENGLEILSLPRKERSIKALEFSEGNKNLYETLMYLWDSGIETISCCIGHQDYDGDRNPHLAVVYNEKSMKFFNTLYYAMGKVFTGTEKLQISTQKGKIWFSINDYAFKGCEELFTKINVIKAQSPFRTPVLYRIEEALDTYKDSSINLWFTFEKNSHEACITKNSEYIYFSKNEDLNDLIDYIKKEKCIKIGKYSFDERSLKRFTNMIRGKIVLNKESQQFEILPYKKTAIKRLNKKSSTIQ